MLFDKNGFYLNNKVENKIENEYDFAINIIDGSFNNMSDRFKIYDLSEAIKRGNLFPNLYDGYKNYMPEMPRVDKGRESCLFEIQMLDFAINELNLYLDLHPDDKYAYKLFQDYVNECKKKKENYTRIYGPLTLEDLTDEYEWSKGVWPWEEGRM